MHDIAILRRHSNGKHSLWKTCLVLENRIVFSVTVWIFRVLTKERDVCAKEGWQEVLIILQKCIPWLTFLYFYSILFLYCKASSYRLWTRWKPRGIYGSRNSAALYDTDSGLESRKCKITMHWQTAKPLNHPDIIHCTATTFVAGLQSEVFTLHCFEIKGIWNETFCN